jgi:hypothetical protein
VDWNKTNEYKATANKWFEGISANGAPKSTSTCPGGRSPVQVLLSFENTGILEYVHSVAYFMFLAD